jgi:flagellar motor switch protein FliG
MAVQTALTGPKKAAVLILTLGEDIAAEIFKHLQEDEIEQISREVAGIGSIGSDMGERVLDEFHQMTRAANFVARGGVDFARRLLQRSIGMEAASRMVDRLTRSFKSTAGFATLEKTDPQQLSKFILAEHPQTIALILAHLNTSNAAELLSLLPESLRSDVMMRMASLDEISPDIITRISAVIEQRLRTIGGRSREQHGGVRAVAELCNRLERSVSQPLLEAIEQTSPELAVSIRNLMFIFDDLRALEDNALREIIQRVDKKALTIALKGASEEIRTRFFANMSKRAGDMLKEEMEVMGAIRLREVEKAQQDVVAITRKLEEEGLIVTGAAAGEAYVV